MAQKNKGASTLLLWWDNKVDIRRSLEQCSPDGKGALLYFDMIVWLWLFMLSLIPYECQSPIPALYMLQRTHIHRSLCFDDQDICDQSLQHWMGLSGAGRAAVFVISSCSPILPPHPLQLLSPSLTLAEWLPHCFELSVIVRAPNPSYSEFMSPWCCLTAVLVVGKTWSKTEVARNTRPYRLIDKNPCKATVYRMSLVRWIQQKRQEHEVCHESVHWQWSQHWREKEKQVLDIANRWVAAG